MSSMQEMTMNENILYGIFAKKHGERIEYYGRTNIFPNFNQKSETGQGILKLRNIGNSNNFIFDVHNKCTAVPIPCYHHIYIIPYFSGFGNENFQYLVETGTIFSISFNMCDMMSYNINGFEENYFDFDYKSFRVIEKDEWEKLKEN